MNVEVEQVLLVQKVRAASVYKLLLYGLLIGMFPLGVVFGIAGFFGADTVRWNQQPIHGVASLFAGPALTIFIAFIFTALIGSLTCLGLWLLSRFRPLTLRVVVAQQGIQADGLKPAA